MADAVKEENVPRIARLFVGMCSRCHVPGFVRQFLGIFYARLSAPFPRIVGAFPEMCRSQDCTYGLVGNKRIPRNLHQNSCELCIPDKKNLKTIQSREFATIPGIFLELAKKARSS